MFSFICEIPKSQLYEPRADIYGMTAKPSRMALLPRDSQMQSVMWDGLRDGAVVKGHSAVIEDLHHLPWC